MSAPAPTPLPDLLGRRREAGRLAAAVDDTARGESTALVVAGEAGAGKTALLRAAVARARAAGARAVLATGHPGDQDVAYTGLLDVARPFLGHLDALTSHQARALRGALGLAPAEVADRFTIGAAALALLAEASRDRPVVVAVDDVQWVDAASREILGFVARRLAGEGIALLLGSRPEGRTGALAGIEVVAVGPLEPEAARALVRRHRPHAAGKEVEAVAALAAGNPLALVVLSHQDEQPDAPGTDGVAQVVARHVAALPAPAREVLLGAALGGPHLPAELLLTALGRDADDLAAVEATDLARREDGVLRPWHPLVDAAAVDAASPEERRRTHLALAEVASDEARAAWHRTQALTAPDPEAAAALAEVGRVDLERGAVGPAADALAAAASLTTDDDLAARRLAGAADAAAATGEHRRAEELASDALSRARSPEVRVAALRARVRARRRLGLRPSGQRELLDAVDALGPEGATVAAEAWTEAALADVAALRADRAREAGERAVALAGDRDDATADSAHAALGAALVLAGQPGAAGAHLAGAQRLLARNEVGSEQLLLLPLVALSMVWTEEYAGARAILDRMIDVGRRRSLPAVLPDALLAMAVLDFGLGGWSASRAAAGEAAELAEQTGRLAVHTAASAHLALLAALQGRSEDCVRLAARVRDADPRTVSRHTRETALGALAEDALARGRPDEVVALLEPLLEGRDGRNPAPTLWEGLLVEALAATGRVEEAVALHTDFTRLTIRSGHLRGQSIAARVGALLPGADPDRGFARAIELLGEPGIPFARARIEVLWGERLLDRGRYREGQHRLLRALRELERLEAAPWADRAAAGLERLGELPAGEVRRPVPLGDRERLVVRAMASGATVEDVASRLFLSPQAVARSLGRALQALGVDSVDEVPERVAGRRSGAPSTTVTLLDAFAVRRGDEDLTPSPGQPATLVQLLAVRDGRAAVEELVEALWPEVDPERGRIRFRNVLARVRRSSPDLVRREGDLVAFADDVEIDAVLFEDEAARALALARDQPDAAAALARRALARCRREPMADLQYHDWAVAARERSRTRLLALLDLAAGAAAAAGSIDEAVALAERAIALEPLDDHRHRLVVGWLEAAGRAGAAGQARARARRALLEAGFPVPADLA